MKLKSSFAGIAAGLLASCAAQAADLPVKAKAIEYVRICSTYGEGFYYIPGTDTCMKIGGYSRLDTTFNGAGAHGEPAWNSDAGQYNRYRDFYIARSRFGLNLDTRTATEYGVVRTYFQSVFTFTTGNAVASGSLGVYFAFIQFAGFTMGKAISQFDAPWTGFPGNNTSYLIGGGDTVTGVNQFSYTADFGQGVTATISAQDQVAYYQPGLFNTATLDATAYAEGTLGGNNYAGTMTPDFVGMVRVDQAWGLFQASAAVHNIRSAYYGASETTGHPSDEWGWAGQLALSVKNIPTGKGDTINMSVGYAHGASAYVWRGVSVPTAVAMYGGSNVPGVYQSIAFATSGDGVFGPGTGIEKQTTFGFRGAYTHNWDANWNSSLFGSYTAIRWGAGGKALICNPTLVASISGVCNPDFDIWQIGTVTRWTPVPKLTFSGEVFYSRVDQKNSGLIAIPDVIGTKPVGPYELKDQGTWTVSFRAQRNF